MKEISNAVTNENGVDPVEEMNIISNNTCCSAEFTEGCIFNEYISGKAE